MAEDGVPQLILDLYPAELSAIIRGRASLSQFTEQQESLTQGTEQSILDFWEHLLQSQNSTQSTSSSTIWTVIAQAGANSQTNSGPAPISASATDVGASSQISVTSDDSEQQTHIDGNLTVGPSDSGSFDFWDNYGPTRGHADISTQLGATGAVSLQTAFGQSVSSNLSYSLQALGDGSYYPSQVMCDAQIDSGTYTSGSVRAYTGLGGQVQSASSAGFDRAARELSTQSSAQTGGAGTSSLESWTTSIGGLNEGVFTTRGGYSNVIYGQTNVSVGNGGPGGSSAVTATSDATAHDYSFPDVPTSAAPSRVNVDGTATGGVFTGANFGGGAMASSYNLLGVGVYANGSAGSGGQVSTHGDGMAGQGSDGLSLSSSASMTAGSGGVSSNGGSGYATTYTNIWGWANTGATTSGDAAATRDGMGQESLTVGARGSGPGGYMYVNGTLPDAYLAVSSQPTGGSADASGFTDGVTDQLSIGSHNGGFASANATVDGQSRGISGSTRVPPPPEPIATVNSWGGYTVGYSNGVESWVMNVPNGGSAVPPTPTSPPLPDGIVPGASVSGTMTDTQPQLSISAHDGGSSSGDVFFDGVNVASIGGSASRGAMVTGDTDGQQAQVSLHLSSGSTGSASSALGSDSLATGSISGIALLGGTGTGTSTTSVGDTAPSVNLTAEQPQAFGAASLTGSAWQDGSGADISLGVGSTPQPLQGRPGGNSTARNTASAAENAGSASASSSVSGGYGGWDVVSGFSGQVYTQLTGVAGGTFQLDISQLTLAVSGAYMDDAFAIVMLTITRSHDGTTDTVFFGRAVLGPVAFEASGGWASSDFSGGSLVSDIVTTYPNAPSYVYTVKFDYNGGNSPLDPGTLASASVEYQL